MNKFLTILSMLLTIFVFVSCVEDDDLEEGLSSDTTPAETSDTTPADPADSGDTGQTGDTTPTDPADTGDTVPADPSDTGDTSTTPTDPADSDGQCEPQCGGKECGSDGCGGLCGQCPATHTCNFTTNVCVCNNPQCDNITCGNDDGCGGICNCSGNFKCNTGTNLCECEPNCDGKQCGDDGCGGSCGECAGDETCTAAQICKGCTKVTLSPVAESKNANGYLHFKTLTNAYTPNTGDTSQDDLYTLSFKSSVVKAGDTVDLSTSIDHCNGKDLMRDTNTLCFFINEDHKASSDPKRFLPKTGTITINSVSTTPKINAELQGIKMYEMVEEVHGALDGGTKYYFVPDGDCIIVENTTLEK